MCFIIFRQILFILLTTRITTTLRLVRLTYFFITCNTRHRNKYIQNVGFDYGKIERGKRKMENNTQRVYVARHEENSSSSLLHRAYIGGWTVKRKEVLESISTSTLRNNTTLSSTEKSSSLHVILLHMCFTATEWRKHCTHRGICRCDWR